MAALHSPSSGIVDSHALMTALLGDAQNAGALYAVASPFDRARPQGGRWLVRSGGAEPFELATQWLVNCAGLHSDRVARLMLWVTSTPGSWQASSRALRKPGRAESPPLRCDRRPGCPIVDSASAFLIQEDQPALDGAIQR